MRRRVDVVGLRFGSRRVLAEVEPVNRSNRRVRWICDCGRVGVTDYANVKRTSACYQCSKPQRRGSTNSDAHFHHARPELVALLTEARERCPSVWLGETPESREAIRVLTSLLGPLTRDEIAALLGVTAEHVRQIEADGMRHMRKRLRLAGVTGADFAEPPAWTEPEPYGDVA